MMQQNCRGKLPDIQLNLSMEYYLISNEFDRPFENLFQDC